jgi:hypothetical protein
MINRPATRIELKLEDDICEYEEMREMKRNNTEMNMDQNSKMEYSLKEDASYNSIQSANNIKNNNLIMENNLILNEYNQYSNNPFSKYNRKNDQG